MSSIEIENLSLFKIGSARYVAWPDSGIALDVLANVASPRLATIIDISDGSSCVNAQDLTRLKSQNLDRDDVFQDAFLSHVLFRSNVHAAILVEEDAKQLLRKWRNESHLFLGQDMQTDSGPYLIADGRLTKVFRLYDDSINAFVACFKPFPGLPTSEFEQLGLGGSLNHGRALAVATRWPSSRTISRSLSGLRMTVKDMFDIRGHRTGLGSRAFHELSEPSECTAQAVRMLLDAGANLVGITQLCAMVGKQEPTQSVDYQAPFNPRGDGFQSPSGGSSGQPSAVAAFDWLDFAIGSDATVSGRLPAQSNGCFSFRPSRGFAPTQGMWSAVPQFDNICVFARSVRIIEQVADVWRDKTLVHTTRSVSSIFTFVDLLPVENEEQMITFNSFVRDLGEFLEVPVERLSLERRWSDQPPKESHGSGLRDFLDKRVALHSYIANFWQKISEYYESYQTEFKRTPFMPLPKGIDLWDEAKDATDKEREAAWYRLSIYKDWILDNVLQHSIQNSIVVMPLGNVQPCYRDEWPPESAGSQQMWEPLLFAPILGSPELVIPAGQMPYVSRVSGRKECLPICVSVMGLPGTDMQLLKMAREFLQASGRPVEVLTGSKMFRDG